MPFPVLLIEFLFRSLPVKIDRRKLASYRTPEIRYKVDSVWL